MLRSLTKLLLIAPLIVMTIGCDSDNRAGIEFESLVDYAQTKIVVLGSGLANGLTILYVEVHSINSNGTANANWVPDLRAPAGSGVTIRNCNPTNEEGVARCAIVSSIPGAVTLSVDNVLGNVVEEEAQFSVPILSKVLLSNVPGSNIVNTSNGYKISASLSNFKTPLRSEDSSGTVVYSTVQGVVLSEEK